MAEIHLGLKVNYQKTCIYRIGSLRNSQAVLYTQKQFQWDDPPITNLGIAVSTDLRSMAIENLSPLINKTKDVLTKWKSDQLSLMGRVLVVNTLIELLFVCKFSALSELDLNIIHEIQDIVWKFIWNNKRAKISYNILKRPKDQGGLRLVDLPKKHQAIMIQHLFDIKKHDMLQKALNESLKHTYLGEEFWKCNVHFKDVTQVCKEGWWLGPVVAWCKYNYHRPENKCEVQAQLLWCNSDIKAGGELINNPTAYAKGLKTIKDICEDDKVLDYNEFILRWPGTLNWLTYNSMLSAIPKRWINIMINDNVTPNDFEYNYDKLLNRPKITRIVYNQITENPNNVKDAYNVWNKILEWKLDASAFEQSFQNIYKATISTQLRDFQYRLLWNRIPMNDKLYRWKIKNSPQCDFCDETDNILHSIYQCTHVRTLWTSLELFIRKNFTDSTVLNFSIQNILLNTVHPKAGNLANLFCLIMKQMIHRYKCQNERLNFKIFLCEIKEIHEIELFNARRNKRTSSHDDKWSNFISHNKEFRMNIDMSDFNETYINRL